MLGELGKILKGKFSQLKTKRDDKFIGQIWIITKDYMNLFFHASNWQ